MPTLKRCKTKYAGVFFIESEGPTGTEKIYYIRYRRQGKMIEEKAGRQFQDDMTPSRASGKRSDRIKGKELSNIEERETKKAAKEAEKGKLTINRIWEKYSEEKSVNSKEKRKTRSLSTDKSFYEKHLKTPFGNKEPHELKKEAVDWFGSSLKKKLSPQTVKHILALLRRLINFGIEKQLCDNIKFKITLPEVHNEKTEDLTSDQLAALLKAIDESEDIQVGNMMKLALYSGMRRSEMFRLQWADINFEKGYITLKDPKGKKDQTIPLNNMSRELLKKHPTTRSKLVFPGERGKQRVDVGKAVNKIKEKAGLPKDFRPLHGLRHVFASMLASSGKVDMYVLQKLLTHKSPQMSQRYAHLRDESLKSASNLTGGLIDQELMKAKQNGNNVVNYNR